MNRNEQLIPEIYPQFPEISTAEVLYIRNTELISPQEKKAINDVENYFIEMERMKITGEIYDSIKNWLTNQKEMSSAESLLSVYINILSDQEKKWGWLSREEIRNYTQSNQVFNRKISKENINILNQQLDYLTTKQLIVYENKDKKLMVTPKIREVLKPKNIFLLPRQPSNYQISIRNEINFDFQNLN